MMGDIYRLTQEALIWIREEDQEDCDFLDDTIDWLRETSSPPDQFGETGLEKSSDFLQDIELPPPSAIPHSVTSGDEEDSLSQAYEVLRMLAEGRHIYQLPFYQIGQNSRLEFSSRWLIVMVKFSDGNNYIITQIGQL